MVKPCGDGLVAVEFPDLVVNGGGLCGGWFVVLLGGPSAGCSLRLCWLVVEDVVVGVGGVGVGGAAGDELNGCGRS